MSWLARVAAWVCVAAGVAGCAVLPLDDLFVRNPIEGVSVHVEGITALSASDVRKVVEDYLEAIGKAPEGESVEADRDDLASRLTLEYRGLGYPHAQVECEVGAPRALRGRRVDVRVTEGPRALIQEIRIEGAQRLKPAVLARFYTDHAPRTLPFVGSHLYVPRIVEEAVGRMEQRYQSEGFRNVVIRLDGVDWSADQTRATVRIVVGEGPQWHVRDVPIEAGEMVEGRWVPAARTGIPVEEIRGALQAIGIVPGAVCGRTMRIAAINAVSELYFEEGYPFAVVPAEEEPVPSPTGDVSVTLRIRIWEGAVARVRSLRVHGAPWTSDHVITREGRHLLTETYRASEIRGLQETLSKLGIFKSVTVRAVETPGHRDWADLDVDIEESDWLVPRADFGYASIEGFRIAPTIDLPNLTAVGHNVQARAILSEVRSRVEAKLSSPWTLELPVAGLFEASWEDRPEPLRRDPPFRTETTRGGVTFSRPVLGDLELLVGYENAHTRVYDLAQGLLVQSQIGTNPDAPVPDLAASMATVGWVLEGRDDRFNPRWGAFADMAITAAGGDLGGNVRFERVRGTASAYASAGAFTLAARGAATAVRYHPGRRFARLPPPYRQFSGGHDTVRSFTEGELGPRTIDDPATLDNEGGSPLGGLARAVVNVELRCRIWPAHPRPFGVGAVLFFDVGTVWPYADEGRRMVGAGEDRERYRTRPTDLAYAFGAGLRIDTPIGPIGVEFGWNPDRYRIPPHHDDGSTRHEEPFAIFVQVGHTF